MISRYKMQCDERGIYPFFDTGMRFDDSIDWYGEDTYFCRRWIDIKGELFIEPRINFTHYGKQEYHGNYHEYLLGRKVDTFLKNMDKQDGINGWTTKEELAFLRELASKSESV